MQILATWKANQHGRGSVINDLIELEYLCKDREIVLKQEQEMALNWFGRFGLLVPDKIKNQLKNMSSQDKPMELLQIASRVWKT